MLYTNITRYSRPMFVEHHITKILTSLNISEKELKNSIQLVKIYLSSATFDEIEKEMKVRIIMKMLHSTP